MTKPLLCKQLCTLYQYGSILKQHSRSTLLCLEFKNESLYDHTCSWTSAQLKKPPFKYTEYEYHSASELFRFRQVLHLVASRSASWSYSWDPVQDEYNLASRSNPTGQNNKTSVLRLCLVVKPELPGMRLSFSLSSGYPLMANLNLGPLRPLCRLSFCRSTDSRKHCWMRGLCVIV